MNFLKLSEYLIDTPREKSPVVMVCASTSSILAIMITYPFDNLRVRW